MARKVTTEDIKLFNELYYKYKTYAEVARQTGWSSSTVSKYIDKNYTPVVQENVKRFDMSTMPEFTTERFANVTNYGDLCALSEEEKQEIIELWKELAV